MPHLTITVAEIARVSRLDAVSDASEIAAVQEDTQIGFEAALDSACWVLDGDQLALIRRGIVLQIAGEVLGARLREAGAVGTVSVDGITVQAAGASDDAAAVLHNQARQILAPYLRRVAPVPGVTAGVFPVPGDFGSGSVSDARAQARLFGWSEAERLIRAGEE